MKTLQEQTGHCRLQLGNPPCGFDIDSRWILFDGFGIEKASNLYGKILSLPGAVGGCVDVGLTIRLPIHKGFERFHSLDQVY